MSKTFSCRLVPAPQGKDEDLIRRFNDLLAEPDRGMRAVKADVPSREADAFAYVIGDDALQAVTEDPVACSDFIRELTMGVVRSPDQAIPAVHLIGDILPHTPQYAARLVDIAGRVPEVAGECLSYMDMALQGVRVGGRMPDPATPIAPEKALDTLARNMHRLVVLQPALAEAATQSLARRMDDLPPELVTTITPYLYDVASQSPATRDMACAAMKHKLMETGRDPTQSKALLSLVARLGNLSEENGTQEDMREFLKMYQTRLEGRGAIKAANVVGQEIARLVPHSAP